MKRNYIIDEIRMQWYSKTIIILLTVLLIFSGILYFINVQNTMSLLNSYNHTLEFEKSTEGDDEQEDDTYTFEQDESGIVRISNPLAYYKEKTGQSLYANSIKNVSSMACEGSMVGFSLIFGIFGLVVGNIEYKNKTTKHKVARRGKVNYIISKCLSNLCVCFVAVLTYFIGCALFSVIAQHFLASRIDSSAFNIVTNTVGNLFVHFAMIYIASITYTFIGMAIAVLTKSTVFGSIILAAYSFIDVPFGKYDLGNSFLYINSKICNFMGAVSITKMSDSSEIFSWGIILMAILVAIIVYSYCIKKKSAYC